MYNSKLSFGGIGGKLQDFPRQPERGSGEANAKHFALVRPWFERDLFGPIESFNYLDPRTKRMGKFDGRVAVVTAEEMFAVLKGFSWMEQFDFFPHLEMMRRAMLEGKLEDWAVLLPVLESVSEKTVEGIKLRVLKRTRRSRGGFSGSSFRQRDAIEAMAGNPDSSGGVSAEAYCTGKRGAMLLTFAADPKIGGERDPRKLPNRMESKDVATIFSFAIPHSAAPKGRIAFTVERPDRSDDPVVDAD